MIISFLLGIIYFAVIFAANVVTVVLFLVCSQKILIVSVLTRLAGFAGEETTHRGN